MTDEQLYRIRKRPDYDSKRATVIKYRHLRRRALFDALVGETVGQSAEGGFRHWPTASRCPLCHAFFLGRELGYECVGCPLVSCHGAETPYRRLIRSVYDRNYARYVRACNDIIAACK